MILLVFCWSSKERYEMLLLSIGCATPSADAPQCGASYGAYPQTSYIDARPGTASTLLHRLRYSLRCISIISFCISILLWLASRAGSDRCCPRVARTRMAHLEHESVLSQFLSTVISAYRSTQNVLPRTYATPSPSSYLIGVWCRTRNHRRAGRESFAQKA